MVERARKPGPIDASASSNAPQPTVDISPDNSRVTAKLPTGDSVSILLYGATILSWKNADGSENLWLSESAALDGSKAVRGGIPVVFPVFGPPPKDHATSALSQHGFARASRWEYLGKSTSESPPTPASKSAPGGDGSVTLDFGLASANLSPEAKKAWPYDFGLIYSVTLAPGVLQTSLNVRNEGKETFEFQALLHTYFKIPDITKIAITGLLSVNYIDKVLNATSHTESRANVTISSETDRVYASIPQDTTSILVESKPRFDVTRDNFPDTVVWNPWIEKAKGMGDFTPKDGYKNMVCVEVGHVGAWVKLETGETWTGGQAIKSLL